MCSYARMCVCFVLSHFNPYNGLRTYGIFQKPHIYSYVRFLITRDENGFTGYLYYTHFYKYMYMAAITCMLREFFFFQILGRKTESWLRILYYAYTTEHLLIKYLCVIMLIFVGSYNDMKCI